MLLLPAGVNMTPSRPRPSDEELDAYIQTRLNLLGVDLGVLPDDDPSAPADRRRVMQAIRRVLHEQMPEVSDYPLDPIEVPPVLYPAHLPEVRRPTVVRAEGRTRQGGEA